MIDELKEYVSTHKLEEKTPLDEKIEEIEKTIERLGNETENDHSEKMLEAIAEALQEERQTLEWLKDYKRLLEALENQKEITPIRTGKWTENSIHTMGGLWYADYKCSECGSISQNNSKYCPNCGAEMGEK